MQRVFFSLLAVALVAPLCHAIDGAVPDSSDTRFDCVGLVGSGSNLLSEVSGSAVLVAPGIAISRRHCLVQTSHSGPLNDMFWPNDTYVYFRRRTDGGVGNPSLGEGKIRAAGYRVKVTSVAAYSDTNIHGINQDWIVLKLEESVGHITPATPFGGEYQRLTSDQIYRAGWGSTAGIFSNAGRGELRFVGPLTTTIPHTGMVPGSFEGGKDVDENVTLKTALGGSSLGMGDSGGGLFAVRGGVLYLVGMADGGNLFGYPAAFYAASEIPASASVPMTLTWGAQATRTTGAVSITAALTDANDKLLFPCSSGDVAAFVKTFPASNTVTTTNLPAAGSTTSTGYSTYTLANGNLTAVGGGLDVSVRAEARTKDFYSIATDGKLTIKNVFELVESGVVAGANPSTDIAGAHVGFDFGRRSTGLEPSCSPTLQPNDWTRFFTQPPYDAEGPELLALIDEGPDPGAGNVMVDVPFTITSSDPGRGYARLTISPKTLTPSQVTAAFGYVTLIRPAGTSFDTLGARVVGFAADNAITIGAMPGEGTIILGAGSYILRTSTIGRVTVKNTYVEGDPIEFGFTGGTGSPGYAQMRFEITVTDY